MKKKKVHLVLGCGGARGIAHIGVIEELEKNGYEIIEIVGSSMGAVVGAMYASGHLNEYKEWLLSLNKKNFFNLMDFTIQRQGFVKGDRIVNKHKDITGDISIENLNIPLTIVATDMREQKEVHFKKGNLYEALRSTVALPGLLVPYELDGKLLTDGGILNPLPVNLINKEKDATMVAVDINATAVDAEENNMIDCRKRSSRLWYKRFIPEGIRSFMSKFGSKKYKGLTLMELIDNTYSMTQDRLTAMMVEKYAPDLLVSVPRNTCSVLDFHEAENIYEKGKYYFKRSLDTRPKPKKTQEVAAA